MQSDSVPVSRRDILKMGVATTAAVALGSPGVSAGQSRATSAEPRFHTSLCDLLGITYPVLQAPMSRIVPPAMVAAVGRAGGLGFLPGVAVPPDQLRLQIREVRKLTDRPFGVNLIMHSELLPPRDVSRIPRDTVLAVQGVLNRFRETLGIATTTAPPPAVPDVVMQSVEVILEERVPVFGIGLGRPTAQLVERCHARGVKVFSMVSTVADAVEVAATGVDAVIAQGAEAGGHRSTWEKRPGREYAVIGTMALLPQVVDAVRVPVIAAGGITNGRQTAAALMLGAQGVLLGTRFIATSESTAPDFYKRALVERDSDSTTVTDAFSGLYARALRNAYTEEYASSGAPVFPAVVQQMAASDIFEASARRGDGQHYPMYAGQGVGMIRDLPPAADIVTSIVSEARTAMASIGERVQTS